MSSSDKNNSSMVDMYQHIYIQNLMESTKTQEKIREFTNKLQVNLKTMTHILNIDILNNTYGERIHNVADILKDVINDLILLSIFDLNYLIYTIMTQKTENTPTIVLEKLMKFMKEIYSQGKMHNCTIFRKRHDIMKVLTETVERFDDIITNSKEVNIDDIVTVAMSYLNLGIMYFEGMKNIKVGKRYVARCIALLKEYESHSKVIMPLIKAFNQMYIISTKSGEAIKSKIFLKIAEELYDNFITVESYNPNITYYIDFIIDNELGEKNTKNGLEQLHKLTSLRLANFYQNVLGNQDEYMIYCHKILSKRLSQRNKIPCFDYNDWAINAALTSLFFMENRHFFQARHYLCAALYMLEQNQCGLKKQEKDNVNSHDLKMKLNIYNLTHAVVAMCCAKFGIAILILSGNRLLETVEKDTEDKDEVDMCANNPSSAILTKDLTKVIDGLEFADLNLEIFDNKLINYELVSNYNDAKKVSINILFWLRLAKDFFHEDQRDETIDYRIVYHSQIVHYISTMYRYLSLHESDLKEKIRMHILRVNLLEDVIETLNSVIYGVICKELWIELGVAYSDILSTKLEYLSVTDEKLDDKTIEKINDVTEKSLNYHKSYLNFLKSCNLEDESCDV